LQDVTLKFAVAKRVFQLSGHVIPDFKLPQIHNVQQLLKILVRPSKPIKLVEEIQRRGELLALPNVTVYPRRVTVMDKERMVGRWKVIERELERRGLPVTGDGGLPRPKEIAWLFGKA